GLLIEGSGAGDFGIGLATAGYVTITNAVIRRFALSGLGLGTRNVSQKVVINVSNTIVAHNGQNGVIVQPFNADEGTRVSFSRVEAYGNGQDGIFVNGQFASLNSWVEAEVVDCVAAGNGFGGSGGSGFHVRPAATGLTIGLKILRSVATQNSSIGINSE